MPDLYIDFRAIVSKETGEPAVIASWGDNTTVMSTADARQLALGCLEIAVDAERDAAMMRGVQRQGGSYEDAVSALQILRDNREWDDLVPAKEGTGGER